MMMPAYLLAKSQKQGLPPLQLEQHLLDTEGAAGKTFRLDRRWGRNWCRFFRLAESEQAGFLLNLRVAALFHDLGKANEGFYSAVTSPQFVQQPLRHEHLSALILHLPKVRAWLSSKGNLDLEVITAAVLSHHLKASAMEGQFEWCALVGLNDSVALFLGHDEVQNTLRRIAEVAGLDAPPVLGNCRWSQRDALWRDALEIGRKTARVFRRELNGSPRLRMLLAVKAGLIVADSAASGLFRTQHSIGAWIDAITERPALTAKGLNDAVLQPRIERLNSAKLARGEKPFEYHEFQNLAAEQGSRALLLAACGAGKSMAAWRWAQAQLRHHELGKVVFLYPTRGTATEGFREYVAPAPEAALLHGTAQYEIDAIQANPDDERNKHFQGKQIGLTEQEQRLYALAYWSRDYFSATVDQFLSFMEHSYMSLCLLPVLADCALIIDEVHSFDLRMFDALESFLKHFDVPVLCMTATLSASRRSKLVECGLSVFPGEQDRERLADLDQLERQPRYLLSQCGEHRSGRAEAMQRAVRGYRDGQRVLWVVNRVAECQDIVRELQEQGIDALCYHSRFRLKDRQDAHQATIAAFQQKERPAIAVTTQVCEMSLDIDADVLLTELAPPSSLVQRFGRANRHLKLGDSRRAEILVYTAGSPRPYAKEDLAAAMRFLGALGAEELSQRDLAQALEQHARPERRSDEREGASFINSGYYAVAGEFRDADDFSESCILTSDVGVVKNLLSERQSYDGFVVPVPRGDELTDTPGGFPKHLKIAPSENYKQHLGYINPRHEAKHG